MGQLYTSLPLTDASTIKQKKDIEEPKGWLKKLQGLFTTDRDNLLKTCEGPFAVAAVSSSCNLLNAKLGIRYFIHGGWISSSQAAATANQLNYITAVRDGGTANVALTTHTTGAISSVFAPFLANLLTDENSAVTFVKGSDVAYCAIFYSEVPC